MKSDTLKENMTKKWKAIGRSIVTFENNEELIKGNNLLLYKKLKEAYLEKQKEYNLPSLDELCKNS